MNHASTSTVFSTPALWVTALLLALCCALLVARPSADRRAPDLDPLALLAVAPAQAGMVSHVGSLAVLTCDVGQEEVLVVLDNRGEQMLVYRVENMNTATLLQRVSLPRVFLDGRHRAQGRTPP